MGSISPRITGIDTSTPHNYLFFASGAAQAVRDALEANSQHPSGRQRKECLFDLNADGDRKDLLADNPEIAARLRSALAKHNSEQEESRWPWEATTAINVDRDLAQPDQPEDEFAYWSN